MPERLAASGKLLKEQLKTGKLTVLNQTVDLELRERKPEDESFLLEVYASTRLEELEGFGWDDNQKQAFIRMQFLARERC